jgi:hypothetical protein
MSPWIWIAAAQATSPGDLIDEVLTPEGPGAPTDGVLVAHATFQPLARVVEGPGAPFDLAPRPRRSLYGTWGSLVTWAPPTGGWVAGADYVLELQDGAMHGDALVPFAFTAGAAPADPPQVPGIGAAEVGEWSEEEGTYAHGCCKPVRTVAYDVTPAGDDAWGWVELRGEFRDGSVELLDAGFGAGPHTLDFEQWREDNGDVEPRCFQVVAVAGDGQELAGPLDCEGGGGVAGCSNTGGAGRGLLALAGAFLVRRSRAARLVRSRG